MEFFRGKKSLSLTAKEAELLRLLINNRGQILSREKILQQVWREQPFITPRTVDVHIAWLRQKIEDNPESPRHIITSRGEGYRFEK
jgi:two-component system alkaline phosphatase synthesis response regulator PhoP